MSRVNNLSRKNPHKVKISARCLKFYLKQHLWLWPEMQAKTLLKAEHLLQYFILYLALLVVESFLGGRCFVNHKKKFYTRINKTW